jgi:hypothetical protein
MSGRPCRREHKGRVENSVEFGDRGCWDEREVERRMGMKRCRRRLELDRHFFDSPKDRAKSDLVPCSDAEDEGSLDGHPVTRYAIRATNPGAARRPTRGW